MIRDAIFYVRSKAEIVSKRDQTNDIHLSGSSSAVLHFLVVVSVR